VTTSSSIVAQQRGRTFIVSALLLLTANVTDQMMHGLRIDPLTPSVILLIWVVLAVGTYQGARLPLILVKWSAILFAALTVILLLSIIAIIYQRGEMTLKTFSLATNLRAICILIGALFPAWAFTASRSVREFLAHQQIAKNASINKI